MKLEFSKQPNAENIKIIALIQLSVIMSNSENSNYCSSGLFPGLSTTQFLHKLTVPIVFIPNEGVHRTFSAVF